MSFCEDTNFGILKDLMAEIQGTPGFPFEAMLASHGLPASADSPCLPDDYEASLGWRQTRFWQEIKRVMHATTAMALEANEYDKGWSRDGRTGQRA